MEKITIHEEAEAIKRTHEQAQRNVDLLNSIYSLKQFSDVATVQAWAIDSGLIQRLFFKETPQAEKLSRITKQEFILPPHLLNLQNLLRSVNNQSGTFTKFDSKKKIWIKDIDAIETYCDNRYRKFATSEPEITRWKFATGYCEFINQIRPGTNGRKSFVNEMAELKGGGQEYVLSPRWQFVFSEYK